MILEKVLTIIAILVQTCLYGENAYQAPAGLYATESDDPLALPKFDLVAGKPLSYNNWVDIDRLLSTMTRIAATFDVNAYEIPSIALGVKHGNACGAGIGFTSNLSSCIYDMTIARMLDGDLQAIHGGLVMVNFPIDVTQAEVLLSYGMEAGQRRLLDAIIAPSFTPEAIEMLKRKKDNCRFVVNPALLNLNRHSLDVAPRFRYVRGGLLVQPNYTFVPNVEEMEITEKTADRLEIDMLLAIAICQTSNSNTITLVKDQMLIGNGVGQQSRVAGAKLAIMRATENLHNTRGAAAASDSFFPFPDGVEVLATAGIEVLFATSGGIRFQEIVKTCKQQNIPFYTVPDTIGRGFFGH